MVTGDIGCTILGMNPPFDLLWNEVSMGSSVSLAQGFVRAGVKTPVIATIGDSTFFHAGIPGLINAIQHRVPLTVVVFDNGWTSMTGMQVNPGTASDRQAGGRRVDLARVVEGLGPDGLDVVDPYDVSATTAAVLRGLQSDGVHVVVAQRECAIQAMRRSTVSGRVRVDPDRCVLCRRCIQITGCPALSFSSAFADEKLGEPAEERAGSPDRPGMGSAGKKPAAAEKRGGFSGHDSDTADENLGGPGEMSASSPHPPRIAVDPTLCNGCGICVSFCPTSALEKEAVE